MNPNNRYPIPLVDGYEIDDRGLAFRTDTGEALKPTSVASACRSWNSHGPSRGLAAPAIDGLGTSRTRSGRTRVKAEELVDGDLVAWLYLQEEHARAIACSAYPATMFLPDEWIPLRGDPGEGWVVITKSRSKIGTMFHGPSVFAWLIERSAEPIRIDKGSTSS